ncbi:MAG: [protein-PII] uridylyltransferase [Pseudomonadaceae bacterium]|nr:[protein-PII] uridylyltransferase [Pseudomonadaceae bacterium]
MSDSTRPGPAREPLPGTPAVSLLENDGFGALRRSAQQRLKDQRESIEQAYWDAEDIDLLIARHTQFHDTMLRELWQALMSADARKDLALYAVGGYGRGELHPYSDIDLLILTRGRSNHDEAIADFVRFLWDIGLEVGHSVRTLGECGAEAAADLTVYTALLERRLLVGKRRLAEKLDRRLNRRRLWPSAKFFHAKVDEQDARHSRYDNIEYGLEPNVKHSPGGLRDLHTALWIMQREFETRDSNELEALGILTAVERQWLDNGRRFLWWVRFGLHIMAGREQDHLQFEFQRQLAVRSGYEDSDAKLAVEHFMQDYYSHVLELREVNDILLQHFRETIVDGRRRTYLTRIDDDFCVRSDYLAFNEGVSPSDNPALLLKVFLTLAQHDDVAGVRASTIRAIRDNLYLIDDDFRSNPEHARLFMTLLRAPNALVSQLTRMRRYGVLGRYIPQFGEIIGQMQHDLFHIYTVDAHTMALVKNLRRFFFSESEEDFPVACHAIRAVPKVELLYIAGLFHDIGKGRGGDHSELGAQYVEPFCKQHGLSDADTALVVWLVREHLTMSSVSQRKDIHDPDEIFEFASFVKSEMRLNYLFALTVADICATNPTLWNAWRASLMTTLYTTTRRALRQGLEDAADREDSIQAVKERATERLLERGVSQAQIDKIWQIPSADFFLRHSARDVSDITAAVADHDIASGPLILVRDAGSRLDDDVLTEIFLFARDQPKLFSTSVIVLDSLELSVQSANVYTDDDGLCFNSYMVMSRDGNPVVSDARRRERIEAELATALANLHEPVQLTNRRVPRQLQQLYSAATVKISNTSDPASSTLTITAADHPGVLALIGSLLIDANLTVLSASITTLGEQIEDVFTVTGADGRALPDNAETRAIEAQLAAAIDEGLGVSQPRRKSRGTGAAS